MIGSSDFKHIIRPIEPFLEEFDKRFKAQTDSKVQLLDTIVKYVVRNPGKRLRPMLVLLAAQACGGVNDRSFVGAAMVELLHTATLIHDDVVDQSMERRGFASINAVWKNKVAVLVGDFYLSRGLLTAVENEEFDFLRITSVTVKRMSEGELLQIQKSRQLDIDEETYYRIISDKTASLLSSCCEIGAVSATDIPERRQALKSYGEAVGMAFQIRDDIFDYLSRSSFIGKPVGNDIKEKKLTLPLIYALARADKKEVKEIMKIIKGKPSSSETMRVVEFVTNKGGIDYAERKATMFIQEAKRALELLPNSVAKQALQDFADFTLQRSL